MPRKKTGISFEEFWKLYPLHKARVLTVRAWNMISDKNKRAAEKLWKRITVLSRMRRILRERYGVNPDLYLR